MRNRIVTFLLVCFAWHAQAQLNVPISEAQAQGEQMRINKEREGLEVQYAAQEVDCYKRFAVNDCLREVRARKRVSMEALRRQEIALNDAQRKTRDLERVQQVQEKNSPTVLKQEADSRVSAEIQHKERLDRAQQKKTDASQRDMQAGAPTNQRAGAEQRSPAQGSSAQAQQAFEEKQRSAKERKAQRDKSLAEKSSKPVSPLSSSP